MRGGLVVKGCIGSKQSSSNRSTIGSLRTNSSGTLGLIASTKSYRKFKKRRKNMSSKNKTTIKVEPGKQDLFIIREFDAPRELVFKAHTDPKLYVQWLGPRGYEMILETFEPKSGGKYYFNYQNKKINQFAFHGVFHEMS